MAKRGAQGNGTIRQRPDGTWEARYVVGRDPGTGKQLRKSVYGKTQKEVRQKLAKVVASLDEGTYFEPSKVTLAQWLDTWLVEYTSDKKFLTVKHYKAQVNTHIRPSLGATKLATLTAPQIQKFYNQLLAGSDDKKGLAPKSVRNIHGILTKALTTAVQVGYLRVNRHNGNTPPRGESPDKAPYRQPGEQPAPAGR